LQKAAIYCLYTQMERDYVDQAEQLLSQSEADGHDVSLMREFLNNDFSQVDAADKIGMPALETASALLSDLSAEFEIGAVKNLNSEDALEILKSVFYEVEPSDPEQAVALLDYARRLAIRGANVYRMEDAILEIGRRTNLDLGQLYLDSISEISQRKLDPVEARKLMETAIPFLKSGLGKTLDPRDISKLAKRLENVAQKFQFTDSLRRLDQLN
jgi:hypothetical protein